MGIREIKEIKRRDFLKMLGVAAAGTALGDVTWAVPEDLVKEALRGPGVETFKNTLCQLCPAGCGIRVRLIDGIPVHIDGNPMHPVNRGGICPMGAAGLDFLYHPDRIKRPLVRTGPKGKGGWREVSWEEALKQLVDRVAALRKNRTPEQLAFFLGQRRGLMYELVTRFMRGFGSPNLVVFDEEAAWNEPFRMMLGWDEAPEFDVENAKYVLSFGANFLEEGFSPVRGINAYGKMRENTEMGRAKLVYVDSRHSLTAGSSDRFVPIRVGTHGAFALGIAYVLIKERHYDEAFIREHVFGFESWVDKSGVRHKGFKDFVLENYYPESVENITGAPARIIVELAREFGRSQRPLALVGQLGADSTNAFYNTMAVISLNVLAGNLEKKGGVRFKRSAPLQSLPEAKMDAVAREGLSRQPLAEDRSLRFLFRQDEVMNFLDNYTAGDLYPITTLMVHGTNPAFTHPYSRRIRELLSKVPFVVSFASFIDETAAYADLILPEHGYMERWSDCDSVAGIHFAHATIGPPVVEPFYDTRHAGDVIVSLARKLGGTTAASLPFQDYLEALKKRYMGIYASGEGAVVSGSFEESWVRFLKVRGWQNLVYDSFTDFWKVLVERGGWWDPVEEELPRRGLFKTESGKAELYSLRFAGMVDNLAVRLGREASREQTRRVLLEKWKITAKGDQAFLPHYEEPRFNGDGGKYPYLLVTFGTLSNRNGLGSVSPMLQEMFGYYHGVYWDSWVELNPETAGELHLQEGDGVEVESARGSFVAKVVINPGLEPSVAAVPIGMGHTAMGRYAEGIGADPFEILLAEADYLWGKPVKATTRIRLRKAHGRAV